MLGRFELEVGADMDQVALYPIVDHLKDGLEAQGIENANLTIDTRHLVKLLQAAVENYNAGTKAEHKDNSTEIALLNTVYEVIEEAGLVEIDAQGEAKLKDLSGFSVRPRQNF